MQMLYQLSYPSKTLMTDPKIFSPGRSTISPIRKLPVFSFLLAGDMRAAASFPIRKFPSPEHPESAQIPKRAMGIEPT